MRSDWLDGVREAAYLVMGKKVEHVVVLDCTGEHLWTGKGTKTKVGSPNHPHTTNVHNHPSGNACISYQDVVSAINTNEAAVVTVGASEIHFLIRREAAWRIPPVLREQQHEWVKGKGDFNSERLAPLLGAEYLKVPLQAFLEGIRFISTPRGVLDMGEGKRVA